MCRDSSSVKQGYLVQFVICDFLIYKKDTFKPQKFLLSPPNMPMTLIHTKK